MQGKKLIKSLIKEKEVRIEYSKKYLMSLDKELVRLKLILLEL